MIKNDAKPERSKRKIIIHLYIGLVIDIFT